jgi:hypothetical protein
MSRIATAGAITLAAITFLYRDRAIGHRHTDVTSSIDAIPLLGDLISAIVNGPQLHDRLLVGFELVEMFTTTLPFDRRIFHTCDPAIIKHIMKDNFSNYVKGEFQAARLTDLLGHGIFNSDGMPL